MVSVLSPSLESEYLDSLKKYPWLEGNVNHMYLDSNGYVTIGRGHLIPNAQEAKQLPFIIDKSKETAKEEDIEKAYERVKKQKQDQKPSAYKELKNNNIILSQEQIDILAKNDIKEKIGILQTKFSGFDRYPSSVQMALLDHWFNVKDASFFIKMIDAVKNKNWSAAAFHSHIKTTSLSPNGIYPRIILKTIRFCQAAQGAGQEKIGSFCYKFLEKVKTEGFENYEDLLNALSRYQSINSPSENSGLIEKLKRIDSIFKAHSE